VARYDSGDAGDDVSGNGNVAPWEFHNGLACALDGLAARLWSERSFHRLLARLLFEAGRPERRYKVLERFYTLPQQLVERLHAGTTTMGDRARILCGKPPVPFFAALGVVMKGDR